MKGVAKMPTEPGLSGPHLQAAFICEKILTERDGVPSYIRVIERFTVPIPPKLPSGVHLPPGIEFNSTIQFQLVVMLKAGTLSSGSYNMKISLNSPNGTALPPNIFQVFFNGSEDNGVAVVSPVAMPSPEAGLYWFDVYFEEELITRIPMRVLHQQMQAIPFPQR